MNSTSTFGKKNDRSSTYRVPTKVPNELYEPVEKEKECRHCRLMPMDKRSNTKVEDDADTKNKSYYESASASL